LKSYIFLNLFKNFLFVLPPLLISSLFYTMNVCFPDRTLYSYKIDSFIRPFYKYSLLFMLFIILLVAVLDTTIVFKEEQFELRNKQLKIKDSNNLRIKELNEEADRFREEKKYYSALKILEDILIIAPYDEAAAEKSRLIKQMIEHEKKLKLKELRNKGIASYRAQDYKTALAFFNQYYEQNPEDNEVVKYINLSLQQTDIRSKRIIKDQYSHIIHLNKDTKSQNRHNNRIKELIDQGMDRYRKNDYHAALESFKDVLLIDVNNYDAYYYSILVQQKIFQLHFFTNTADKLVRNNLEYITDQYRIRIGQLARTESKYASLREESREQMKKPEILPPFMIQDRENLIFRLGRKIQSSAKPVMAKLNKIKPKKSIPEYNDYILHHVTFMNLKDKTSFTRRYGYYDSKLGTFIFQDSFVKPGGSLFQYSDINPELIWSYHRLMQSPESFSLYKIITYYPYFKKSLNDLKTFSHILTIKINYFILIIFLFLNLLILAFYMRKREGAVKVSLTDFLLLPLLFLILYTLFHDSFLLLKNIISIGFSIPPFLLLFNVIFYVLFFILFFIFFQVLRSTRLLFTMQK
ncbi:MAG: hypothetical protein PHF84_11245, partial [bacterium]|nr:hypothetical protein [bacterium]